MNKNFLRVFSPIEGLGGEIAIKGYFVVSYIPIDSIKRFAPIYTVDNCWCVPSHEGAKLWMYAIHTVHGDIFRALPEDVTPILGVNVKDAQVGFLNTISEKKA